MKWAIVQTYGLQTNKYSVNILYVFLLYTYTRIKNAALDSLTLIPDSRKEGHTDRKTYSHYNIDSKKKDQQTFLRYKKCTVYNLKR